MKNNTERLGGLIFESILCAGDGYGGSAEQLVSSLSKKISLSFLPMYTDPNYEKNSDPELIKSINFSKGLVGKKYLQYSQPAITESLSVHRKLNIERFSFTMFESTQLPSAWPNKLNSNYNRVIVPSEFCQNLFRDSGINIPIEICPLGVDTEFWRFSDRRQRLGSQPFTFLLLFARHNINDIRKNTGMVLSAFKKAFHDNEDVRLIVKCSKNTSLPPEYSQYKKNVEFITEFYPKQKLLELYKKADAFVFPSLGEGFGLPPREAMATGLPTILCNWSSLTDIAKDTISFPIQPIGLQPARYGDSFCEKENGGKKYIGEFCKISEDELVHQMINVFSDQHLAMEVGKRASDFILSTQSYHKSSGRLLEIINDGSIRELKELGKINQSNRRINGRQRVNIVVSPVVRAEDIFRYKLSVAVGQIPPSKKSFKLKAFAIKKKTGEIDKEHSALQDVSEFVLTETDSYRDKMLELVVNTKRLRFDDYSLLFGLYQEDVKWHEQSIVEIKL